MGKKREEGPTEAPKPVEAPVEAVKPAPPEMDFSTRESTRRWVLAHITHSTVPLEAMSGKTDIPLATEALVSLFVDDPDNKLWGGQGAATAELRITRNDVFRRPDLIKGVAKDIGDAKAPYGPVGSSESGSIGCIRARLEIALISLAEALKYITSVHEDLKKMDAARLSAEVRVGLREKK